MWLAAGVLAMVVFTFIAGNQLIVGDRAITRSGLGLDFTAFYAAGTFTREGRLSELYDLSSIAAEEHRIARDNNLDLGSAFGPYWNPPVVAWLFAPLSALPYPTALNLWLLANVIALGAALWMLAQMLPPDEAGRTRHRWLLVLLVPLSMPAIQALSHGQNTCISLLLVTGVVTLWRGTRHDMRREVSDSGTPITSFSLSRYSGGGQGRGSSLDDSTLAKALIRQTVTRAFLAVALAGLLAYKPQLAAIIGGVLILDLGWMALAGMACTGLLLLAATLISMPGMLGLYLHRLPAILHFMQVEHPYLWDRHVTLTAFWRLLFQGTAAGETMTAPRLLTMLSILALAGLLCRMLWASRNSLQLLPPSWRTTSTPRTSLEMLRGFSRRVRGTPRTIVPPVNMVRGVPRTLHGWDARSAASITSKTPDPLKAGAAGETTPVPLPGGARDRIIAATVAAMPLLMPFYFDYDLLLLTVPATLFAAEWINGRGSRSPLDIWTIRAWICLYLWLFFNPPLARLTHFNLTVILLSAVAALLLLRAAARRLPLVFIGPASYNPMWDQG